MILNYDIKNNQTSRNYYEIIYNNIYDEMYKLWKMVSKMTYRNKCIDENYIKSLNN